MWEVTRNKDANIQIFFNKNKEGEMIFSPIVLANRYELVDILSADGGFGIIYHAIDKRVCNRKVLVKARRYDNVPGLFLYQGDEKIASRIEDIRDEIEFEIFCLKAFKDNGESRMPTLNDVVNGFCPSIYGPHKDILTGEEFHYNEDNISYDEPYIIMQYIEGENFQNYSNKRVAQIKESNNNNQLIKQWEYDVLGFALELATVFESFHKKHPIEKGKYINKYYIYQDLKPSNMIITEGKFLTLLDFGGMLEIWEDSDGNTKSNLKGKGKPGTSTYGYRAPELSKTSTELSRLDNRVDIYSFGATIFSMLVGEDLIKILKNENDPIPLDMITSFGYSEITYEMLKKCLEENKEDRLKDMFSVKTCIYKALEAIKRGR